MKSFPYIPVVLIGSFLLIMTFPQTAPGQESISADALRKANRAGIEQPLLDELSARVVKGGITEQTLFTVIHTATEMADNNLPYEMIFKKAFEGLSKGVASGQIERTVTTLQQNSLKAAEMMDSRITGDGNSLFGSASDPAFRDGLIVALSNVMENDISAAAAGEILTALSTGSLPAGTGPAEIIAAIRIIPAMTALDDRSGTASGMVVRALKGRSGVAELQKLSSAMEMARARNRLPATVMLETVSGRLHGLPAHHVLQNSLLDAIPGGPAGVSPAGLENPPGGFRKGGL